MGAETQRKTSFGASTSNSALTMMACLAMLHKLRTEGSGEEDPHPCSCGQGVAEEELPWPLLPPIPLVVPVTVSLLDENKVQLFHLKKRDSLCCSLYSCSASWKKTHPQQDT